MKKYLDRDKIKELHSKGLNDNEIARELNASVNGIRYVRKDILGLPHNTHNYNLTKNMISVIVGTLLGDAWIGYVYIGCKYHKYQTSQSEMQHNYILNIYNELKPIMTPNITELPSRVITVNNKEFIRKKTYSIGSRNCECLVSYREAFYPNGKKIIPIDFIKDKFTTKSLAYWYMDDGSLDKNTHSYIFNTQSFSRENLEEFISFLYNKFGLSFTIKKDNTLYLKHCSNKHFEELISQYLTTDMQYKLMSSLNSVKQGNS